uniref:ATP synthase complex subunit 8 n=3 Tax=Haplochromini TaxID=319058 RepID=A0A0U2GYH4_9CICH
MPQLNPSPWFAILVFSWLVFLTLVIPKILQHIFLNDPLLRNLDNPLMEPWDWPWF